MGQVSNSLLVAVASLQRVEGRLNVESRVQLSKSDLNLIKTLLSQCFENMNQCNYTNDLIQAPLVAAYDLCTELLKQDVVETDTLTKECLGKQILPALDRFYVSAGKYYMTHDFDYTMRLTPLLKTIVDRCIDSGYYFDVDKEIVGGQK